MENPTTAAADLAFLDELAHGASGILMKYFQTDFKASIKADQSIVTEADLASERFILGQLAKYYPDDLVYAEESGLSSTTRPEGRHIWIIDPLDGTTNFYNGLPFFAVSIARARIQPDGGFAVRMGCVIDPLRDQYYAAASGLGATCNGKALQVSAMTQFAGAFLVTGIAPLAREIFERDLRIAGRIVRACHNVRRDGSAALDMALVASGVYDGFWEYGLKPWDVAAGSILIREAGGLAINYGKTLATPFDVEQGGLICGGEKIVDLLRSMVDAG